MPAGDRPIERDSSRPPWLPARCGASRIHRMPPTDQGEPLAGLDRVLDRLLTVLQAHQPYTLDGAVREHVEVAIEAAMAAAGRARETPLVRDQAQAQIH